MRRLAELADERGRLNEEFAAEIQDLRAENDRLREALRKIAESGVLGYSQYRDLAWAALEANHD